MARDPMNPLTYETPSTVPPIGLRPREAAAALGISEKMLNRLTTKGNVPHARLGRCVVYPVAQLQQWLAQLALDHAQIETGDDDTEQIADLDT